MFHSFSWKWPPFPKMSTWQPYLYRDAALLAMGDWVRSVTWSNLDKSESSNNLKPELRTREQSSGWLESEYSQEVIGSHRKLWLGNILPSLWMKKQRKPTEKGGRKERGKGGEDRRRRKRRWQQSQKEKNKAKRSGFLTEFQFLVTAPSYLWDLWDNPVTT